VELEVQGRKYCGDRNLSHFMVIMALCATEKSGLENCGQMLVMMLGEQNPEVASQARGAGRHLPVTVDPT
jgi:hypothetical protein